jgi:hypothetical protein
VAQEIQKAAGPWTSANHNGICQDRLSASPDPAQPVLADDEIEGFDLLEDLGASFACACCKRSDNRARADMGLIREEEGAADLGI